MNALVIGASPLPGQEAWYRGLVEEFEVVVACDAAGEWCAALGRTPDVAVGDFDSAEEGATDRLRTLGVEVVEYSAHKKASDLDLGVDVALARGADSITVTAAFANRLDHTLAAVGLALRVPAETRLAFRDPGLDALVLCAPHSPTVELAAIPGDLISIVALTQVRGLTLRGLEYPLDHASLSALSSLGVSNVAVAPRVTVHATQGTLLVMSVDDSWHGIQVPRPLCR